MISNVTLENIESLTEIDDKDYNEVIFFVVKKMISQKLQVTAAESLTAGMFQSSVADVSGASSILKGGFITYANESKEQLLGIPHEIINKFGVVSSETAKEMAIKSKNIMEADIGVGLTGVAGPSSLENKDAGTVYIAISYQNQTIAHLFKFRGDRKLTRRKAVLAAFLKINSII